MKRVIQGYAAGLMRLCIGAALLSVMAGFLGAKAFAFGWDTCEGSVLRWNSGWTNMYVNTNSFPSSSVWDNRLQNAMWHWNNVKGSSFTFYVGYDTDGTYSHGNGVNEVYASGAADNDNGALAVTHTRYHCYWLFGWQYGIDETDISFNTDYLWNTGAYSYGNPDGSPYNFEGVALHELGHALGLNHEDRWLATMNSYYPNSGPVGYYKEYDPVSDDRQGARFIYPDATTETDIAGSALKRTGAGTSYLVSSTQFANLGDVVQVEYTFHNMGTQLQSFDIGFYLSTNDFISTADTLLGTNFGAWGAAGFSGTFTRSLYIPTDTPPGTYYLGFLLDPMSAVAESVEGNNSQPMPRTLVVLPDTTPPSVSLIAPTAGQVLTGLVNVQASAFDNIAMSKVDFYAGATLIGSDSVAPYQVAWNVAAFPEGTYTITARATDRAGNTATSAGVSVSVVHPSNITINDVTLAEGNSGTTMFVFTVSMLPARAQSVSVNYATSNGTAVAGSDFAANSGTVIFAPGQTSKTIAISVVGDTTVEANETFSVLLSAPSAGASIGDRQGVGTIVNDDGPRLRISDASGPEGNSGTRNLTFAVNLSPASTVPVTVKYATANGTAAAGSDYTAATGTLTFAPGETSKTLAIAVSGDTNVEPNETFTVNLSAPTNATLQDAQGIGLILNDDGPLLRVNDVRVNEGNSGTTDLVFTVTLSPASSSVVSVNYATSNATAVAGSDYTATSGALSFSPGQTTKTIAVKVIGDTVVETNQAFYMNLSGATGATIYRQQGIGTIVNDD